MHPHGREPDSKVNSVVKAGGRDPLTFIPATFTSGRPDRLLSSMLTINISSHPDLPSNQVRGGLPTAGNVEMHKPIAAASGLDNGLTFEADSRPVSVMNIRPLLK